ncbi:MAG TPA: TIGR03619 family F420-dependent LLM class oxidoreductase [Acidimicrobiales bacterium]|nr:TIGR03619 family F420-dependent LLM class oxidoreductase [Acidimicrobiales bacterium]
MEVGVRIPHTGRRATPEFVRSWCETADRLGFDSLWGVDHVVMPQRVDSKYVLPREPASIAEDAVSDRLSPNFELMTTLGFVAAVTERIKLGTAVAVLPIRNAVLNARQLATVDRYSGGRLLYGVGVGWLKEEADAMRLPWDRRGARSDEHITLLRALWTALGPHVEFHGEFWDLPPMDPEPRPVQRPIPILIGGHSEVAIERAARLGDGWIAANMSSDRLAELLPLLHRALERHGRHRSEVPVYCGARREDVSVDGLRRYQDLGVRSVQVPLEAPEDLERFAGEVLPALR